MNSGLEKILEKIAEDPANRVLMERYVALVSEFQNDQMKADYILKLARALAEPDPRSAMEFAFSVFQYDQKNVQALELISGCLRILGRFGKSEVIKNEIAKIRKLQEENKIDYDLAERFVTEVSAIRVDHFIDDDAPIAGLPDDAFVPDFAADPKATIPINNFQPKPMSRPAIADPKRPQQDQVKLELNLIQEKAVTPRQPIPDRDPLVLEDVAPIGTIINNQDNLRTFWQPPAAPAKQTVVPVQQNPANPVYIPSQPPAPAMQAPSQPEPVKQVATVAPQIAPVTFKPPSESTVIRDEGAMVQGGKPRERVKVAEEMPSSWVGPDLGVLLEQFEFLFKQGMMQEAEKLIGDTEPYARHMTWWKARRAILDTVPLARRKAQVNPEIRQENASDQSIPKDSDSYSGRSKELKAWMKEIEGLIAEGKSRKALSRLRTDLRKQTDVSWGMGAMDLLQQIWDELGLQGFQWLPGDGMEELKVRLKKRQPVRLAMLGKKFFPKNSA